MCVCKLLLLYTANVLISWPGNRLRPRLGEDYTSLATLWCSSLYSLISTVRDIERNRLMIPFCSCSSAIYPVCLVVVKTDHDVVCNETELFPRMPQFLQDMLRPFLCLLRTAPPYQYLTTTRRLPQPDLGQHDHFKVGKIHFTTYDLIRIFHS